LLCSVNDVVHQQHLAVSLPGQVVNEEVALSQDLHERRKVGFGPLPDLHLGSHEVQPSDPVEPV
jgi:hypothetical protein